MKSAKKIEISEIKDKNQMKKLPWSQPNYKPEIEENEEEIIKNDEGKQKKFYDYFKEVTKDQIKHQDLSKD